MLLVVSRAYAGAAAEGWTHSEVQTGATVLNDIAWIMKW